MCSCYACLHCHSAFSLLDGMPTPTKIVQRCKELGLPACAITDHGSIGGLVEFQKAGKKYGIKTIPAIELYVSKMDESIKTAENKKHNHLTVLAKNNDGIKALINLVSHCNKPENFYRKPRIGVDNLSLFAKDRNLICLSGCIIGELSSSLFEDVNNACLVGEQTNSIAEVRKLLKPNWRNIVDEIVSRYINIFGKENYFLEIQEEGMPAQKVVVECLREVAKSLNIPSVATLDAHYLRKQDAEDHRILLYSQMHTSAEQIEAMRKSGGDVMSFFYRDTFYILSPEEMQEHYTKEEMETSLQIADMVKCDSLGRKPCLPKYKTEENQSSIDYIKTLCIKSAKEKFGNFTAEKKNIYWERLKRELAVIKDAGLADYFLIVYDACKFVDENNGPRGKGRGSGAGSLVNYLLNITKIDPIEYGLYFERFYNVSRSIPPHYDVGSTKFTQWLSDNYNKITEEKIVDAKNAIVNTIRNRITTHHPKANNKILNEERNWIDNNNPKMWLYIQDMCKQHYSKEEESDGGIEFENSDNSHIVYMLGKNCYIDLEKPFKIHDGHISLPDIDTDIGVDFREKVIEYLINKWGEDKVSQMITFGRLQGKAALKEVFRAQPDLVRHLIKVRAEKEGKGSEEITISPFDLCNEITSHIPDEATIVDELQQIREETENDDYGILHWAIDHIDYIKESYKFYKPLFDQAMRLEGTKKSQSKHAAGLVISDVPINELVPLVYDAQNKARVVGFEMASAEMCGLVKFDFLGVVALDKMRLCEDLVNGCDKKNE